MSSHHSRAFVLRHHDQQDAARERKEQKVVDRLDAFLRQRDAIRFEVKVWQWVLVGAGLIWLLYCAGVSVSYAAWLT